jgi:hypothetical protein
MPGARIAGAVELLLGLGGEPVQQRRHVAALESLASTSTVPPDSPKPRESHVSTLKPARRSGRGRPGRRRQRGAVLVLSRAAPQPWVSRIVGAFWPGARPSAGKKLGADRRAVEGRDDRRRGQRPWRDREGAATHDPCHEVTNARVH